MTFWLRDVPGAMRHLGWTTSANVMDRWFSRGAYIMTKAEKEGQADYRTVPAAQLELGLVTMAWALRFERIRIAAEQLRQSWLTPNAIALLRTRLERSGALHRGAGDTQPFRFGDLSAPTVAVHHGCQANTVPIGGRFDPFDDFYGAIGRGNLFIAVTGECRVADGAAKLKVDGLGIYMRDSYEFIGAQPLGYWNRNGVTTYALNNSAVPIAPQEGPDEDVIGIGRFSTTIDHYYQVTNQSFQDYQRATGRGGDFTIFSDVRRVALPSGPVEVTL